jgi:uncharacterized HAD superfamily protein
MTILDYYSEKMHKYFEKNKDNIYTALTYPQNVDTELRKMALRN